MKNKVDVSSTHIPEGINLAYTWQGKWTLVDTKNDRIFKGVYTEGMTQCYPLLIVNQKTKRLALCHCDYDETGLLILPYILYYTSGNDIPIESIDILRTIPNCAENNIYYVKEAKKTMEFLIEVANKKLINHNNIIELSTKPEALSCFFDKDKIVFSDQIEGNPKDDLIKPYNNVDSYDDKLMRIVKNDSKGDEFIGQDFLLNGTTWLYKTKEGLKKPADFENEILKRVGEKRLDRADKKVIDNPEGLEKNIYYNTSWAEDLIKKFNSKIKTEDLVNIFYKPAGRDLKEAEQKAVAYNQLIK